MMITMLAGLFILLLTITFSLYEWFARDVL